jgi:hypothetical protein
VLVAVAVLGLLAQTSPVAGQTEILCSGYEGYFYQGAEFTGEQVIHKCYGTNYSNLGLIGWNDRVGSFELSHSSSGQGIIFYWDINYGGASWKVCGNTSRPDLGTWYGEISSWKWVSNCPV